MAFNAIKFKYSRAKSVFGENTMAGRTLVQIQNPVTQSVDAIKSLLAFVGRSSNPLPSDVSLENGRLILVLSNKKDVYYCTTATKCSCPSAAYRPDASCKHQRKYFPQPKGEDTKVADSIRPTAKWAGGHNGPVDEIMGMA